MFRSWLWVCTYKNIVPDDEIHITNYKSAVRDYGIIERVHTDELQEKNVNFLHGIPPYHIKGFFRTSGNIDGNGILYIMFSDCSKNWEAIEIMQRISGGVIN